MNILAIDIGNTRVTLGAMADGKAVGVERFAVAKIAESAAAAVEGLWTQLRPHPAARVVVCSVNPPAAEQVVAAVRTVVDWPVLFIGPDIELPMPLEIENAATVGADRVVAAAAAFEAVGGPLVVASFGTALTISAVSAEGKFLGGVICPGLRLGAKVLHENTAALPLVEIPRPSERKFESDRLAATRKGARHEAPQAESPPQAASEFQLSPFAKTTAAAIQAGLFYQAGGTLREVVERMATEFGAWPHLVVTGGDAELISHAYEFVDSVVPNLVLLGINLAFKKHVESMGGKR